MITGAFMADNTTLSSSATNGGSRNAIDESSPYYVHNPVIVLVSPVLTRQNYHQWAQSMELSLITKNRIGFIDGTIPIPSKTDSMFSTWRRANNLVVRWIFASVSESIAKSILYSDAAYNIWNQLKKRFSQGDLFRISDIEDSIIALKQGALTVTDYLLYLSANVK